MGSLYKVSVSRLAYIHQASAGTIMAHNMWGKVFTEMGLIAVDLTV